MTPQERDLLDRFLSDLTGARPGPKDAEAADRIDRALRANPDAAYVLVQHAILADGALQDAQKRIAELQAQAGPPQGQPGGFLGGGPGQSQGGYGQQGYGQPQGYAQAAYPQAAYPPPGATSVPPTGGGLFGGGGGPGPFSGGGGLGGFLRSAGTTAAGVAGGAFLFEGLSGMFGGHHGGFGGGGFGGGENVTINEFGGGGGGYDDGGDMGDGGDYGDDNN